MVLIDLIRAVAAQVWRHAAAGARGLNRLLDEADEVDPLGGEERIFQPPATFPALPPRRRR